jgi:phage terminase large subunit-like protein
MFTTAGYQGGDRHDRADALVWAFTELITPPGHKFGFA